MKKILLLGLLLAGLLIVYGCASDTGLTPEEQEVQKLFGKQSLAGQATSMGCRTITVLGCNTLDNPSGVSITDGGSRVLQTIRDQCVGRIGVANDYNCEGTTRVTWCRNLCGSGERCQAGQCTITPPRVTVGGASQPVTVVPNVDGTRTVTTTASATSTAAPLVQVPAGTDFRTVTIQASDDRSEVVVRGVTGTHYLYIPINNNGPYACPSAQTLAEVSPTCAGVLSYTHAQCADSAFTACQVEGSSYKVQVSGSGAGQNAAPSGGTCGNRCEGTTLINQSADCSMGVVNRMFVRGGLTADPLGRVDCATEWETYAQQNGYFTYTCAVIARNANNNYLAGTPGTEEIATCAICGRAICQRSDGSIYYADGSICGSSSVGNMSISETLIGTVTGPNCS